MSKLSANDIVTTQCSFCDGIKDHAVIGIIDEGTVRIQCNSCDNAQDHPRIASKQPGGKSTAAKKTKSSPKGKKDPAIAENKEWVLLQPNMNAERAVAYDMGGKYPAKTLLQHSTFGLGMVTRVAGPHKVEVLFECGKKLLCCN